MRNFFVISLALLAGSSLGADTNYKHTCEYNYRTFEWGTEYGCYVIDENFDVQQPNVSIIYASGKHLPGKNQSHVEAVFYEYRNMKYLPRLARMYWNYRSYRVENSNLQFLGNFKFEATLRHLNFDGNFIKEVPKSAFTDSVKLEWFSANNNLIGSLDEDVFSTMPQLRVVSLAGNRIRQIGGGLFRNNHNLQYVYFNGNGLARIGTDLLHGQSNLVVINFDSNICINDAYYHDNNAVANLEQQFKTYCSGQCDNAIEKQNQIEKLEDQNKKMRSQNWNYQIQKQMKCGHQGRQQSSSSSSSSTSSESSNE